MIKLATVSPCYNEEEVLEQSAAQLMELFDELISQGRISDDSMIVFVNDGSRDRTWEDYPTAPQPASTYKGYQPRS